jgi:transaldolase
MKPTQALHEAGQSLWLDNITRALLDKGILARYVAEYSVTGLTSNPTIFDRAIKDGTAYDADIAARKANGATDEQVFFDLALADLRRAAALAAELQHQGAEAFAASWQDLLARIGARHEQLARTS